MCYQKFIMSWRVFGLVQLHREFRRIGLRHTVWAPNYYYYMHRHLSESSVKPTLNIVEKHFQEKLFSGDNDEENQANSIRNMTYTFAFLGLSLVGVGSYILFAFGRPQKDSMGTIVPDEFNELPTWEQYLMRAWKRLKEFTLFIQEPSRDKLLPDPMKYPYYQPPYTLVLEFTDVLAHPEWTYQTGWRFKKRPGVDQLLENLSGMYEIVVFTAEPGMTIFPVIEALDQKGLISYKLVRDSTHFIDGHHVKNLDKLNRDLKKVIVIDWNSQSVKFHSDNHLAIHRWKGKDDDNTLADLGEFLKTIAQTDIEDVREVLKFYKQFDDPLMVFKQKQQEFIESQLPDLKSPPPKDTVKRLVDLWS